MLNSREEEIWATHLICYCRTTKESCSDIFSSAFPIQLLMRIGLCWRRVNPLKNQVCLLYHFLLFLLIYLFLCISVWPTSRYIWAPCACLVPTKVRRELLDLFESELLMGMRLHVGSRNQTILLYKSTKSSTTEPFL